MSCLIQFHELKRESFTLADIIEVLIYSHGYSASDVAQAVRRQT